jgi:aryl sulfotransferase
MRPEMPVVEHIYKNHHLDSTRWSEYSPRDGDVVITTAYKSGTTWTQKIFYHLIYDGIDNPPSPDVVQPWPDCDFFGQSREALRGELERITEKRYLKCHLPLDGLTWYPQVRYVIVCRDPRDVFMSLFNHYSRYTDVFYEMLTESMPRCPEDPREFWKNWITRGWFDWETEGYPFWSNLHHTQSYWEYRHLPNLLFIHYNDMLADLPGAIRRLADFTSIEASNEDIERVTQSTTFSAMKREATRNDEENGARALRFAGGESGFIFKGTNGRWKQILTEEDLALYWAARSRVLSPDCAAWLENGGPIPGSSKPQN